MPESDWTGLRNIEAESIQAGKIHNRELYSERSLEAENGYLTLDIHFARASRAGWTQTRAKWNLTCITGSTSLTKEDRIRAVHFTLCVQPHQKKNKKTRTEVIQMAEYSGDLRKDPTQIGQICDKSSSDAAQIWARGG